MTQEFVTYEQALALKELGFDEECFMSLNPNPNWWDNQCTNSQLNSLNGGSKIVCSAPLKQQCLRWFRDKKLSDSYIYRYQDRTDGSINFGYSIINDYGIEETRFIKENYTSYEEAEDACINKLIELLKLK